MQHNADVRLEMFGSSTSSLLQQITQATSGHQEGFLLGRRVTASYRETSDQASQADRSQMLIQVLAFLPVTDPGQVYVDNGAKWREDVDLDTLVPEKMKRMFGGELVGYYQLRRGVPARHTLKDRRLMRAGMEMFEKPFVYLVVVDNVENKADHKNNHLIHIIEEAGDAGTSVPCVVPNLGQGLATNYRPGPVSESPSLDHLTEGGWSDNGSVLRGRFEKLQGSMSKSVDTRGGEMVKVECSRKVLSEEVEKLLRRSRENEDVDKLLKWMNGDLKTCVEMCEPPVRDEVLKPEIKLTNGARIKDIKRMSQEI